MITQASGQPCWEVKVNWAGIAEGNDLSHAFAELREYPRNSPLKEKGTIVRIHELKGQWDEGRIADLQDNLARLISPFSDLGDFNIWMTDSMGDKEK